MSIIIVVLLVWLSTKLNLMKFKSTIVYCRPKAFRHIVLDPIGRLHINLFTEQIDPVISILVNWTIYHILC